MATIGMKMDLGTILEEPKLILIGLIWMSIHAFTDCCCKVNKGAIFLFSCWKPS